jgi:fatty acid-binding protein DegV
MPENSDVLAQNQKTIAEKAKALRKAGAKVDKCVKALEAASQEKEICRKEYVEALEVSKNTGA